MKREVYEAVDEYVIRKLNQLGKDDAVPRLYEEEEGVVGAIAQLINAATQARKADMEGARTPVRPVFAPLGQGWDQKDEVKVQG